MTIKEEKINSSKKSKASHDSLIKKAMENPLIAQELFSQYLPDEYKNIIDLTTLKAEKESYVEESLRTRLADMVFSAKIIDKQENAFLYILAEHQSFSDH